MFLSPYSKFIIHFISNYRVVFKVLFLAILLISPIYAQEQLDNSIQTNTANSDVKKPPVELKRVKEIGGEVIIDGSLRVLEPIMGKVWDVVEISTPVTPATNHARIFLTPGLTGSKQQLSIIFDDGSTAKITNN